VDVTQHGDGNGEKQKTARSICSWVVVSDMALVVKRAPGENQLIAYATNLLSGAPLPGATIRSYRRGRLVAEKQTDARGLVQMSVPTATPNSDGNNDNRLLTIALRGDDEAVLGRNEYDYEEGGRYTVAAYTDRPIYRPGQIIHYKGIARGKKGAPGRYQVPAGQPVTVEIRDPNGERLLRAEHRTNRYGSFFGQVELSPEVPTGAFTLVSTIGGESHTSDVTVAAYRKPEFSVSVTPEKPRYVRAAGEQARVTVEGKFYFGAPVAGAKITYSVYREADWSAEYPDEYADEERTKARPVPCAASAAAATRPPAKVILAKP
jgi:uncharacterized protein YfaS (alpha-2-macroglobulin family)